MMDLMVGFKNGSSESEDELTFCGIGGKKDRKLAGNGIVGFGEAVGIKLALGD